MEPLSVKDYSHLLPLNQDIYFHAYEPVGHTKKISLALCVTSARQTNSFNLLLEAMCVPLFPF